MHLRDTYTAVHLQDTYTEVYLRDTYTEVYLRDTYIEHHARPYSVSSNRTHLWFTSCAPLAITARHAIALMQCNTLWWHAQWNQSLGNIAKWCAHFGLCCTSSLARTHCGTDGHTVVQMDKTWSAQASRPYDPYLTPKGEEQVLLISSVNLAVPMLGRTPSTSARMLWEHARLAWHLV